MTECSF